MQAGQSDWKHVTKYTIADGQTEGIWYDAGGTFIGDNKTTLEAADDAATRKLGSPWRMPTKEEIRELLDHCTWNWTTQVLLVYFFCSFIYIFRREFRNIKGY